MKNYALILILFLFVNLSFAKNKMDQTSKEYYLFTVKNMQSTGFQYKDIKKFFYYKENPSLLGYVHGYIKSLAKATFEESKYGGNLLLICFPTKEFEMTVQDIINLMESYYNALSPAGKLKIDDLKTSLVFLISAKTFYPCDIKNNG